MIEYYNILNVSFIVLFFVCCCWGFCLFVCFCVICVYLFVVVCFCLFVFVCLFFIYICPNASIYI